MKTLVLVFHPGLTTSRANQLLTEEMEKQENVTIHRVYEVYPDEQLDVGAEQRLLENHDRIVLQFPFYWYSTPPLLKKWEDAVLSYGWAFGSKGNRLHGKDLLIAVTTGAAEENYSPEGNFKYTVSELLRPLQATSNLIGTRYLKPYVLYGVNQLSDEQLAQSAKNYVVYALNPELETLPIR
ncbi:NAD(P)H-dependent oxidoreductase [Priestia megaterium]|jgi:putative NADPH-quinone reductase|uniref:NAD(P)H-dependent oxidoreductase n=1 Tax=Priestia megaterium TaxID=1404 RepID=UPI0013E2DEFF|nr:NAD(P)H-dependent oxidoreductase [Priestia megaterium]MED3867076.1 NAD(P)H-dependent oxidoreductase [Priestia megaterium]MED4098657.1 NAD(P)H-dependent oxidoreductase [Priestia megaterium]MED4147003.1 NAD(P)H-dependent oxidoreductase [Priestia megaterium]MED4170187.1 NAD(P)H-dependent oxidoreductase [Priestia megaterium]MED4202168.1 NAD(P)H-dependent oxidoreductase [Priestia megaterium]